MTVLNQIAYFQNRRDELPNQELARQLAETQDADGLQEIAQNLWNKNRNIQSDCLKVLYETGYLRPDLIADFVGDFLKLLRSKNNRMVWGAMIALSTIADLKPREIWTKLDNVTDALEKGSVITTVWGVTTLAKVAAASEQYREKIFPILLQILRNSIPRDVPTHAEHMLIAVDEAHRSQFRTTLESREPEMSAAQAARLKRVLKQLGAH